MLATTWRKSMKLTLEMSWNCSTLRQKRSQTSPFYRRFYWRLLCAEGITLQIPSGAESLRGAARRRGGSRTLWRWTSRRAGESAAVNTLIAVAVWLLANGVETPSAQVAGWLRVHVRVRSHFGHFGLEMKGKGWSGATWPTGCNASV